MVGQILLPHLNDLWFVRLPSENIFLAVSPRDPRLTCRMTRKGVITFRDLDYGPKLASQVREKKTKAKTKPSPPMNPLPELPENHGDPTRVCGEREARLATLAALAAELRMQPGEPLQKRLLAPWMGRSAWSRAPISRPGWAFSQDPVLILTHGIWGKRVSLWAMFTVARKDFSALLSDLVIRGNTHVFELVDYVM